MSEQDPKNVPPFSSDEVLERIRAAAETDNWRYGSDTLTAQYNAEIQLIYGAICQAQGRSNVRGFWTQDGEKIRGILDGPIEQGIRIVLDTERLAVAEAGKALGIELSPDDIWEEAAMRLRHQRGTINTTSS